jgi:vacuolar-type H+-ATPase subunit I/STV1
MKDSAKRAAAPMAILAVGTVLNKLGIVIPIFTNFCVSAQPLFFTGAIIATASAAMAKFVYHFTDKSLEFEDDTCAFAALIGLTSTAVGMAYHLNITPTLTKEFIGIIGAALLVIHAAMELEGMDFF